MSYRGAELYVQPRTMRRLRWIAKAIAGTTADELGDKIINEIVETRYPQVKQLEEAYEAAEQELREALNPKA